MIIAPTSGTVTLKISAISRALFKYQEEDTIEVYSHTDGIFPKTMTNGKKYRVWLGLRITNEGPKIKLYWSYSGQSEIIIPQSFLVPAGKLSGSPFLTTIE